MQTDNTIHNVLRFMQIRPAAATNGDGPVIRIVDTAFARELAASPLADRRGLAQRMLHDDAVGELLDSGAVQRLLAAVRTTLTRNGTVGEFDAAARRSTVRKLPDLRDRASDLLLATKFAGATRSRSAELGTVFRAANALVTGAPDPETPLVGVLREPVSLPPAFRPSAAPRRPRDAADAQDRRAAAVVRPGGQSAVANRLLGALGELVGLVRPTYLHPPDGGGDGDGAAGPSFALNDTGLARLSVGARRVLDGLGLDPTRDSLDSMVQAVDAAVAAQTHAQRPALRPAPASDPPTVLPYLRDVGVADLLVVKQHLRTYERADIAHVENVLSGETKARTHRTLEQTEETITVERETTTEKQTELETAERFELNKEVARTVQRDQEFGFGLTVSGKYGPTVEFSSNLDASTSTSTEESTRSATRYAKDVVERSLERVVERVREQQVRRILREEEETNLHELRNETGQHTVGVYQYLEKVYESQIFNYGIRQMFDFIVPEPASYLWHLEGVQVDLNLPPPPSKLEERAPDASAVNELNYLELAAAFGADDVKPPPPVLVTAGISFLHPQDAPAGAGASEQNRPRSTMEEEIQVPEGYRPYKALVHPLALTDNELAIAVTVGHSSRTWQPLGSQINLGADDLELGSALLQLLLLNDSYPYDAQSKMPVQVVAYETNNYALAVEVVFIRTRDAYRRWQIATYDKLTAAYRDAVAKYEATVADLKAEAEAEAADTTTRFRPPPSQNLKTIKNELKKHAISIVTRQRYEDFDVVQDADPPYFDFDLAAERGAFTRFFEQAFEWDQLQYVCYPYYWGGTARWAQRLLRSDVDPTFLEFLQAGAARVVVPVRPGFELSLTHYLETLELPDEADDPPSVTSELYLPIVKEIQERTDAPQGELPVGDPWSTRLPTPLAILRPDDSLPKWKRADPATWDWEEA